jgi:subtilisin family serine protease
LLHFILILILFSVFIPCVAHITGFNIDPFYSGFEGRADILWTAKDLKLADDRRNSKDCSGHGSHVAGIIGGKVTGIAKEVQLHAIRVLGCLGEANNQDIIEGLNHLIQVIQRPAIVNLSLGPRLEEDKTFYRSELLIETLNKFTQDYDVPVVFAAGNDNIGVCSPISSDVKNLITVGALSRVGNTANFERAPSSNFGPCVNFYAPGDNIWV